MIRIDLLKNHPESIPRCAEIWYGCLGKIWSPDTQLEEIELWFQEWLNDTVPLAHIALFNDRPIGCCSLQLNDGIRPDLQPWLGDLVVDPPYRNQGVGRRLIDATKKKAQDFGFKKLYLFTFDSTIPDYYSRLGWIKIGMDEFNGHSVTVMEIALNQ